MWRNFLLGLCLLGNDDTTKKMLIRIAVQRCFPVLFFQFFLIVFPLCFYFNFSNVQGLLLFQAWFSLVRVSVVTVFDYNF